MIIAILILVVILALLAVLLLFDVVMDIRYEKDELGQKGEVWVKYLFLKTKLVPSDFKKSKKKKEEEEEPEQDEDEKQLATYRDKIAEMAALFSELKEDLKDLLRYFKVKHIYFEKIDFEFVFGLDDPMYTGIINGLSYALAYNILGFIDHNTTIKESKIDIKPDFNNPCHHIRLHCILRLKNVHIIAIIVKTVKMYFKIKKRVKKGSNQHVRTSNSRADGHSHV